MSMIDKVPGDLTIVYPQNNHIEFSCRQKGNAVHYWDQPSGALVVERALEGHSNYYIDPSPATQWVKQNILFSDWSASRWSRDKMLRTLFLADQLQQKGYTCWALDNGIMRQMMSGNQLVETLMNNSDIVSNEFLIHAASSKGITRDKLRILGYNELNTLLYTPVPQKSPLYFSDLEIGCFDLLKKKLGKLKKAHHCFTAIVCEHYSPTYNEAFTRPLLMQHIRDESGLSVIYQFRTMQLTPAMLGHLANLEHEGQCFDETHWRTIEALNISAENTIWSLPDVFFDFIESITALKEMSIPNARNVNCVRLVELTPDLECLNISGTDVSNETLMALAPRLKYLNIQDCHEIQWDVFDYSVFSKLESIVPDSCMDLSALIQHAPHLNALDLSTFPLTEIPESFSLGRVETVFLNNNTTISSTGLTNLLRDAPYLKNLHLDDSKQLTELFSPGCLPALQNLYLKNSDISSSNIENLLQRTHYLKKLQLSGCKNIEDFIGVPPLPYLIEANLSDTDITSHGLGYLLQNTPALQQLALNSCQNIAEDFISRPLPSLIKLSLNHSSISSQSLGYLLQNTPSLQRLEVSCCNNLVDDFTCGPLTSLTTLTLDHSNISSQSLENLLKNSLFLQELSLEYCEKINSNFSCGPLHSLTKLNVFASDILGQSLEHVLRNAPNLTSLNIDDCSFEDDWNFEPLSLPFLERLDMAGCNLSVCSLESLLVNASCLKEFDLYGYKNFDDDVDFNCGALPALEELSLFESTIADNHLGMLLRDAPALKNLSLVDCEYIDDSLTCGYLPALELLSLYGSTIGSSSLKKLLMSAPALKKLYMSGCQNIDTDFTCDPLLNIETLDLSASAISSKSLDNLLRDAPALKSLNLSHCEHITDFTCGQLPALEELDISGSTISKRSLKCLLKNAPALKTVALDSSFLLSPELEDLLRGITIKHTDKQFSSASSFPIAPIRADKYWDADTEFKGNTLQGKRIFYPLIPGGRTEPDITEYRLQTFTNLEVNPERGSINKAFRLYNDNNPELWEDAHFRHLESLDELPSDRTHLWDLLGIQDFMLNDSWQPLASVSHLDQLTHLYTDPSDSAIEVKYSSTAQQYYIRQLGASCPVRVHFVMHQPLDILALMSVDSQNLYAQLEALHEEIKGYGSQELEGINPDWTGMDYLNAIRVQKQGACRHRSIAFMAAVKERFPLIPVRIVSNDVHAFAEVVIDGDCYKYDLGGYPVELDIDDTNRPECSSTASNSEDSCSDESEAVDDFDDTEDFEFQESRPYRHPKAEVFERSLTTWEKATLPLTTVAAYCQNAMGHSVFKNRLIEMPSEEAVQELQCAFQRHCRTNNRPVLYIHSPDDLVCQASTVRVVNGKIGQPKKGPGGRLYDFLTQHAGSEEPPVLVVNYSTFSADDLARFNTLLKKPRNVDGVSVPEDLILIGLTNTEDPEHHTDEDFYSLFKRQVEVCPLSSEQLAETRIDLPFDTQVDTPADGVEDDVFCINLFHAIDWKARLVGRWILSGNHLVAEEGLLVAALKSGKKIVLENAPWGNPDFQRFWRQTLIDEQFNTPCGPYPFQEGTCLQKKKQDSYDWSALSEVIDFDLQYVSGATIFNPLQLQKLFRSQRCQDNALYTEPGLLQQHEGQTLHLNLTRVLSKDEWAECLSRAREFNVRLQVHLPPALEVPDFLAPYKTASSSSSSFTLSDDHVAQEQTAPSVIVSSDPDTTVARVLQAGNWTVLDISECLPGDLVTRMKGEFNKEEERFIFSEAKGILETALDAGTSVLLTGTIPLILADALSAFMEERKQTHAPGRLLIITDSAETFPWASQIPHQVSDKEKRYWLNKTESATAEELQAIGGGEVLASIPLAVLQARLRFIRQHPGRSWQDAWNGLNHLPSHVALTPFDAQTSANESKDFHEKRLQDVMNTLEYSPYVFLTGLTGVGKTTFVDRSLSQHGRVYHGESSISAWARDCSEGLKFLFIDEANLSTRNWSEFEGLFHSPPTLRINGVLHTLTPEHRVVFAGNPTSYSDDRHLAPFFTRHGGTVLFEPLPLASIYEDVLKPMFNDSGLDAATVCAPLLNVYQFACEHARDEVLLTPRELQMMALCILSTLRKQPDGAPVAIARYYAHAIAEQALPKRLTSFFNASFKPAAIPPEVQPPFLPDSFKVMPSRESAFILLDSILRVRAFRQSLPDTDSRHLGGLGGLLLDGKPSIGNSSLIKAVLKMHHYQELGPNDEVPEEEMPYYRVIPASMPAQEKEKALLRAFHEGAVVFMQGINNAPIKEDLLNGLLMGTDPKGQLARKAGFVLLGTQGPITMPGRQAQSRALARRLITVSQPEYTSKEKRCILRSCFPSLERDDAAALVKAFDKQLAVAKQHGVSPEPCFRDLVTLAQRVDNELANEEAHPSGDTLLNQNGKRTQRAEEALSSTSSHENKRQRFGARAQPSRTGMFRQSANRAASSSASTSSSSSQHLERSEAAGQEILTHRGKRSEPTPGPSSSDNGNKVKRGRVGEVGRTQMHRDDERPPSRGAGLGMFGAVYTPEAIVVPTQRADGAPAFDDDMLPLSEVDVNSWFN